MKEESMEAQKINILDLRCMRACTCMYAYIFKFGYDRKM